MTDIFWLDTRYSRLENSEGESNHVPQFAFNSLYTERPFGHVLAIIVVGLFFVAPVIFGTYLMISNNIQIATEELPAIGTVLQCTYTPQHSKSNASMNFLIEYSVNINGKPLSQGTADMSGDYLNDRSCTEFPPGTTFKIKFDPNHPEVVDIVDDRIAEPASENAFFIFIFLVASGLVLYLWFRSWRGLIRYIVKARQYPLLRNQGEKRMGEIVACRGRIVERVRKGNKVLAVTVRYKFLNPQGIECYGRQSADRKDLGVDTLPKPGTPVIVLYVNDQVHCIL